MRPPPQLSAILKARMTHPVKTLLRRRGRIAAVGVRAAGRRAYPESFSE